MNTMYDYYLEQPGVLNDIFSNRASAGQSFCGKLRPGAPGPAVPYRQRLVAQRGACGRGLYGACAWDRGALLSAVQPAGHSWGMAVYPVHIAGRKLNQYYRGYQGAIRLPHAGPYRRRGLPASTSCARIRLFPADRSWPGPKPRAIPPPRSP